MTQQPGWVPPGEPAHGVPSGPPPAAAPFSPPAPPAPPANAWGTAPGAGWSRQGAPRPGVVPLRPLSLTELYDGAFQSIRSNPRTMVGFAAIVMAITTLVGLVPQAAALTAFGDSDALDPARAADLDPSEVILPVTGLLTSTLVPALLQLVALWVVTGLLIVAVSEAVLGRRMSPGALWKRVRGRVPALLGMLVLQIAAYLGLMAVLVLPGIGVLFASTVTGIILIVGGGLVWILVTLTLYLALWAVAIPALLLEDLGVVAALRRSWRLVSRSFWRVLGITLLTLVMVGFLQGIISLPFTLVSIVIQALEGTDPSFAVNLLALLVSGIGTILAAAVFFPFSAAVTALLYIDLRMRSEGLDVELIRASERT